MKASKIAFFQKKEETNLFDPLELRDKLTKITNKGGPESQNNKNEKPLEALPIEDKLKEIKTQIEQNQTDTAEQFEKTQNGIREVIKRQKILNKFDFLRYRIMLDRWMES